MNCAALVHTAVAATEAAAAAAVGADGEAAGVLTLSATYFSLDTTNAYMLAFIVATCR